MGYKCTHAVVSKPMLSKVIWSLTAKNNWSLHHVNIVTAFLNAEMKESVFIELPD